MKLVFATSHCSCVSNFSGIAAGMHRSGASFGNDRKHTNTAIVHVINLPCVFGQDLANSPCPLV